MHLTTDTKDRAPEAAHRRLDEGSSRRILVPLDGSHLAAAALPYAVALAHATEAPITLLAVVDPVPESADWPSAAGQETDERHVTESTAYLQAVALPLRASGLAVTALIRHGNSADTILATAQTDDCSLIVMSTHGRTGLERLRMGSVAQHVLRHAGIPTLVVPPCHDAVMGADTTITGVTVPLDGSPVAEAALPMAVQIATALSVPLTLFRVIPSTIDQAGGWGVGYDAYYPITEEMEHDEEEAVALYLQTVAMPLRVGGLVVHTVWQRSVTSRAEEIILTYLRSTEITVMASHGRGGVVRWVLGSTAEAVLHRAPCPVLIVRAGTSPRSEHEELPARVIHHGIQTALRSERVTHAGEGKPVATGKMIAGARKATAPTDTELAHAVTDTIGDIPMALSSIDVSVRGGTVTLHGSVTDDLERSAAENAVRRIHGVQWVVNRITNAR